MEPSIGDESVVGCNLEEIFLERFYTSESDFYAIAVRTLFVLFFLGLIEFAPESRREQDRHVAVVKRGKWSTIRECARERGRPCSRQTRNQNSSSLVSLNWMFDAFDLSFEQCLS